DAVAQVSEVDGYANAADLMVNSRYHAELDEVSAFEGQVSSHGGLGGPQTHPFLLHPVDLVPPDEPIFGSPAMYRGLKAWLADPGQPVRLPWREQPAGAAAVTGAVAAGTAVGGEAAVGGRSADDAVPEASGPG